MSIQEESSQEELLHWGQTKEIFTNIMVQAAIVLKPQQPTADICWLLRGNQGLSQVMSTMQSGMVWLSKEIVCFSTKVNVHLDTLCIGHKACPQHSPVQVYEYSPDYNFL